MPVFDGLLEEPYNGTVLDLLFSMATWHGLAKLRQHNDTTLQLLEDATAALGTQIRRFARTVCPAYETRQLPGDVAAEGRRRARRAKTAQKVQTKSKGKAKQTSVAEPAMNAPLEPKRREYNLKTYKLHALGHYVQTIREFGTTDSYSTQTVWSI